MRVYRPTASKRILIKPRDYKSCIDLTLDLILQAMTEFQCPTGFHMNA